MQIVQQMWTRFHGIVESVLDAVDKGVDYVGFEKNLRKQLNELGREACKSVLEAADQRLVEHREERPGWRIQRRDDVKSILTPFGRVEYSSSTPRRRNARIWSIGKQGTGRTRG